MWLQILEVPHEKIVQAFQMGKGRLISFIKTIINNQCISKNSYAYRNLQLWDDKNMSLNDVQWSLLDADIPNDYEGDVEIHKNEIHVANPADDLEL